MPDIRIYPAEGKWVVRAAGAVIAESRAALELVEGDAPFVICFPREDIAMDFLAPSERTAEHDAFGMAAFFHIDGPGGQLANAAHAFDAPAQEHAQIAGLVIFDAGKVTVERV